MDSAKVFRALLCVIVRRLPLPDNFVYEIVLAENLVEHHLDVVAGVPVAVVVEAAGLLEHAGQFDAARAHEVDVGLRRFVAVLERSASPSSRPRRLRSCDWS